MIDASVIILLLIAAGIITALVGRDETLGFLMLFIALPVTFFVIAQVIHPGVFLVGAIPAGLLLGKFAYDEIKVGKQWIIGVSVVSLLVALMGLWVDTSLVYFGLFGAVTSGISLLGER